METNILAAIDWEKLKLIVPWLALVLSTISLVLMVITWAGNRQRECRGEAPWFVLTFWPDGNRALVEQAYEPAVCLSERAPFLSDKAKSGTTVILMVRNLREKPIDRHVTSKYPIGFSEQQTGGGNLKNMRCFFFKYELNRDLIGTSHKITMRFEMKNGYQGRHVYETRHGEGYLKRIKPKEIEKPERD